MTVLFAPHADDETLFAFYLILAMRPRVVICFPSERDYGATQVRLAESRRAMALAGVHDVEQWAGEDLVGRMRTLQASAHPVEVWAPHRDSSHPHHVAVTLAAEAVFGDRVRYYHTYDALGKVRDGERYSPDPVQADLKRRALACYRTQIEHPRARVFYDETVYELDEYVEPRVPALEPTAVWDLSPEAEPEAAAPVLERHDQSQVLGVDEAGRELVADALERGVVEVPVLSPETAPPTRKERRRAARKAAKGGAGA